MVQYGRGIPGPRASVPNPVKQFNNLNYCFSCGYDLEDQHMSKTCLDRTEGHQAECNRNNVQQYMATGYFPSLKGQHKNQMPVAFWQVGSEIHVAEKINRALIISLIPTQIRNSPPNDNAVKNNRDMWDEKFNEGIVGHRRHRQCCTRIR